MMLVEIPSLLTPDDVAQFRATLELAPWADGKLTAGYQSAIAKNNAQLPERCDESIRLGERVLEKLQRNLRFMSAALPARIYPPLFNRYAGGQSFGTHVDNAIRAVPGTPQRIRTDLSATLFLSDPSEYDGGELLIEDTYGAQSVKLPAGHMILYPATSLHQVRPVTRGARVASFFWIQSLVRDDGERSTLFDIDMAIQRLRAELGDTHAALISLTGSYHNLLRRWAQI
jgi:PKHD-type hydroxylase